MDPELLYSFIPENRDCFDNLIMRHPELGIIQMSDNRIGCSKLSWVITDTDGFRNTAKSFLHIFNLGQIIEIDDSSSCICTAVFCRGCFIGGKHDSFPLDT